MAIPFSPANWMVEFKLHPKDHWELNMITTGQLNDELKTDFQHTHNKLDKNELRGHDRVCHLLVLSTVGTKPIYPDRLLMVSCTALVIFVFTTVLHGSSLRFYYPAVCIDPVHMGKIPV